MGDYLIDLFTRLIDNVNNFGYFIVFFIAFAESLAFVGLLVPGVIIIAIIGFISVNTELSIIYLLLYTFLGAFLGDLASFILGKRNSGLIRHYLGRYIDKYIKLGDIFIQKHGNKSILFSRFVGPMRPVVPFIAGICRMRYRHFIFWGILSSAVWAAVYLFLGFYGAKVLQIIFN